MALPPAAGTILACVLTRAYSSLLGLALLASRVICLIVIAWFVVFAVNQTKAASQHQQQEISGGAQRQSSAPPRQHRSTATKTLDEAAEAVTQPFASIASKQSNEWLSHGIDLVLALLIYGLAVGFLARLIRLRV